MSSRDDKQSPTGRESDAYDVGRDIGREAKAVGILMNFAPVVDVNNGDHRQNSGVVEGVLRAWRRDSTALNGSIARLGQYGHQTCSTE